VATTPSSTATTIAPRARPSPPSECKASVGEDPTIIELVRLDTETLDATTITGWEGTFDDLDEEDAEGDEEEEGDE